MCNSPFRSVSEPKETLRVPVGDPLPVDGAHWQLIEETARHVGHAEILHELTDGAVGY